MKFFQNCGADEQVLKDAVVNNKPFPSASARGSVGGPSPKMGVGPHAANMNHHHHRKKQFHGGPNRPEQEYQYVRMEYGYDYAPPSMYVPPHTVDASTARGSKRGGGGPIIDGQHPVILEPDSDVSGSESDEEYIANSRRDRRRQSKSDGRGSGASGMHRSESRSRRDMPPMSPHGSVRRADSVHQNQLGTIASRRLSTPPHSVERRAMSSGGSAYRQQRRPSRSSGYHDDEPGRRPRNEEEYYHNDRKENFERRPSTSSRRGREEYYDDEDSPRRPLSRGNSRSGYRERREDREMRDDRDGDMRAAIIDRVPTAAGYHSDTSEEIDARSRVSRYSVDKEPSPKIFGGVWDEKRSEPMYSYKKHSTKDNDWDEDYDIMHKNLEKSHIHESRRIPRHGDGLDLPPEMLPRPFLPPQQLVEARLDGQETPPARPRRPSVDVEYEHSAPVSRRSQKSSGGKEKRGRSLFGRMRDTVRRRTSSSDKSLQEMRNGQMKDLNRSYSRDRSKASQPSIPPSPHEHSSASRKSGQFYQAHEDRDQRHYYYHHQHGRPGYVDMHSPEAFGTDYGEPQPRHRSRSPYYHRRQVPPSHHHTSQGGPPTPQRRRGDPPEDYHARRPPQSPYERSGRSSPYRLEDRSLGYF